MINLFVVIRVNYILNKIPDSCYLVVMGSAVSIDVHVKFKKRLVCLSNLCFLFFKLSFL